MPRDSAPPSPPANVEAEQGLLGAVLLTPECLDRLGFLHPEHFYEPVHADIFRLARQWYVEGRHVSPVTLKGPLGDHAGLKELGGAEYLARLAASTISIAAARDHGEVLLELYGRREIINAAERAILLASGFADGADAAAALTTLDGDLDAIRGSTQRRPASISFSKALSGAMKRMVAARDEGPACPTGLAALDRKIGGLFAGDMLLLGGRPSMGKTAVAQSIAQRIARRNRAVIFASLEMQSEDLVIRMASEALRERGQTLPYQLIRSGRVTDDEAEALLLASRDIEALPIHVIESHVRRLTQLQAEIRRLVRKITAEGREVGAVIIDYLGLIDAGTGFGSDNSKISYVSQQLKAVAGENKVPLIVLSQLNRAVEQREDKRPQLADLRDSGSLEQDADAVIFCYRDEYYHERKEPPPDADAWVDWKAHMERVQGRMDLIVAKQRMGPIGSVKLRCDLKTNSLWDDDSDRPWGGE